MAKLHFFPGDYSTETELCKIYKDDFQKTIFEFWDKLKVYIEWDSPEATVAHYRFPDDYNRLWDLCRRDHVVLKHEPKPIEYQNVFERFNNDQLQMLFGSENIHKVVRYFKWYRENHKEYKTSLASDSYMDEGQDAPYYSKRLDLAFRRRIFEMKLSDNKERTPEEIEEIENGLEAVNYLHYILDNPKEMPELTDMILNHLQYMDHKELKKLLMLIDKNFEQKSAGRPKSSWKVMQYDMKGNLVNEYNSRTECMEKNNIKKSLMSLLISGKRQSHKGYKYIEVRVLN